MLKILIVWELGEGLGHVVPLSNLVKGLINRNHDITLVLKDISQAKHFFDLRRVRLLQAPDWWKKRKSAIPTTCYADILETIGYLDIDSLQTGLCAWRSIFDLYQPDHIIFDSAPTAMIAASGLTCKKTCYSNPFSHLPPGAPLVDLAPWLNTDQLEIRRREEAICDAVNTACLQLGIPLSLRFLSSIYQVDCEIFNSTPHLDTYRFKRVNPKYLPIVPEGLSMRKIDWPCSEVARIFVYLKPVTGHFDMALKALNSIDAEIIICAPGASSKLISDYDRDGFRVWIEPVDLSGLISECDLVICHGGIGLVNYSLLHGKPLLLFPLQLEQKHTALCCIREQVGMELGSSELMMRDNILAILDKQHPSVLRAAELSKELQQELLTLNDLLDFIEGI